MKDERERGRRRKRRVRKGEGKREKEGKRGKREVLSAQHPKLTCSIYCHYLKYDASQGV